MVRRRHPLDRLGAPGHAHRCAREQGEDPGETVLGVVVELGGLQRTQGGQGRDVDRDAARDHCSDRDSLPLHGGEVADEFAVEGAHDNRFTR